MAKRKNNIDDIDIVDDFELEDIDDFDPFDVLDDSYEDKKSYGNDKPRGGNASNKRNKNKIQKYRIIKFGHKNIEKWRQ